MCDTTAQPDGATPAPPDLSAENAALRQQLAELRRALDTQTARAEAAETARTAQAAWLDSLLSAVPVGVALFDTQLRFVSVNAALARFDNRTSDLYPGQAPADVQPQFASLIEPVLRRALERGEPQLDMPIERIKPAPAMARNWLADFHPVRGEDGAPIGVAVVVREETERLRAAQTLRERDQQLRLALEAAELGTWRHDIAGRTIELDERARAHFGFDSLTIGDATLLGAVHPDDADRIRQAIVATLSSEDARFSEELRVVHPDGSVRWLALEARTSFDGEGAARRPVVAAGITQDITARRQADEAIHRHTVELSRTNAELTRALRLKDEFLAMMSHELRTPLNIVLGYTEGLADEVYGPVSERQQAVLTTVAQNGRHLLTILSDILDLAQIETADMQLAPEQIDVDALCRAALQSVSAAAQQKHIRLIRSAEQGVDTMRGDQRRLLQVLTNLLDNAVKFTPAEGSVGLEVAGDLQHERITFTVWDTGIGIDPASYDRLFQPFTQVDGGLARQYSGVGLGLALVRRLVELHGGSVSVQSSHGQGSRFIVQLPWGCGAPAAAPCPWSHAPRVLIADDHELTLQLYAAQLERCGCVVALARDGAEAVEQARAARPDVAVIDIYMPNVDGLQAIRQLRADPSLQGVPVLALTALAMPGDRERCFAAGADAYLAKPLSPRGLLAHIAELLERDEG